MTTEYDRYDNAPPGWNFNLHQVFSKDTILTISLKVGN